MAKFYEFFAGGGMARAGFGSGWECLFANDFDAKKAASYTANWGADELHIGDVGTLTSEMLTGAADAVWASFPCQDLSLAGAGAGLRGERSGTFWPFWRLMQSIGKEGRAPRLVVLENVCGALTSHHGRDFAAIGDALADEGYKFGAIVIDAVAFVPQSRPRLFFIGVKSDEIPAELLGQGPSELWHTPALVAAYDKLSVKTADCWLWWNLPAPKKRTATFADIIEAEPTGVDWHTAEQTAKLLGMMSPVNLAKVEAAKKAKRRMIGGVYRRTRFDEAGHKVQRAEVRFDDIAGCLRTPTGGSSRQSVLVVEGQRIRSRLLSPREAVRLMGLPDKYKLPKNYNEAYHLAGDGVVVPVVRFLVENLLEPILSFNTTKRQRAA